MIVRRRGLDVVWVWFASGLEPTGLRFEGVEAGILGPLRVIERDREVVVGGARDRALLAALALTPGETQSPDRLVDALWGERPPPSAAKQLQNHVLRLRKALGADAVRTTPAGYALGEVGVDSIRFEAALREARVMAGRGAACESVSIFAEALGLWRARPFEELADWAPAQTEVARLEELRRSGQEDLIDARLACATEPECVADLEALVAAEPLRERRWAQLMLALYRSARQADALRAFERARETLARELGIEPGPALQAMERQVLAQDPELLAGAGAALAVAPLPSGVVTFVLTDIVGSTSLWEQHPKAMAEAVARHDVVMQDAVRAHQGTVLKARGEGDSTFSVFTRATDALAAVMAAQRALLAEPWPESVSLSVRMALHTGEAFERDGDYYGPTVNRAARIRNLAAGGQILVSHSTAELVQDNLPAHAALVGLGSHALSDLTRSEQISGLAAPGLPELVAVSVGPESSTDAFVEGLDVPLPARLQASRLGFVGRVSELERLAGALKEVSAAPGYRAVLVSGEPGIGKTALLSRVAADAHDQSVVVLYGRCDEDLGIPYQPWVEALSHLVEHAPEPLLRAHVAARGGDLLALVPGLGARLGTTPAVRSADQDTERHLLFAGVVDLVDRVAAQVPVLVVLDDLHWADRPSLLLLRHVVASATRMHLLVLATFRTTEVAAENPLEEALAVLHREPGVERMNLGGLDDVELLDLVQAAAGDTLPADRVALRNALAADTDGNPFFVLEILRHLAETRAISQGDNEDPSPIRELSAQRFAGQRSRGHSPTRSSARR